MHHPHHIYLDNAWYLVTAATAGHARLLTGNTPKAVVRDTVRALVAEFGVTLLAWVVLDNHYHLLLRTKRGSDLSRFVARLHGTTSRHLNLRDGTPARRTWHNYWDSCIRTEVDLWTRFNYIHHNPVKHGCAARMEDWLFSSYRYYLRTRSQEWLQDCWLRYPAVDYAESDDDANHP